MSDNIPIEIQIEIIRKLPVKSLIQFRSVSKSWKSLIDSSNFIADYNGQAQHIAVRYEDLAKWRKFFVSIADNNNNTFPQHIVTLTPPISVKNLVNSRTISSSHGLLFFSSLSFSGSDMAVLWNISIRKAVAVVVPVDGFRSIYKTVLGFGVCHETIDPKIVKIRYFGGSSGIERISCIPNQVEVFTLSTGVWRRPNGNLELPRKSIKFEFDYLQVVVGGFLYFLATDRITLNGGLKYYKLIISFDMTNEEFKEIKLPDSLALARHHSRYSLTMSKLKESLVVVESVLEDIKLFCSVWMMEDGVSNLFTKLFTFNVNTPDASVRGFRMSGEPIIEIREDDGRNYKLVVYDPCSKRVYNLGIHGMARSCLVHSYKETLLLLDQPNLKVFNAV